jgi:putative colanic acid biosynthesis acetyltransferase WcaF
MDESLGIVPRTDGHVAPSFTRAQRARRVLWNVVYALLFRPSPRPCHAWRAFLLKSFGARVGRAIHIYPKVRIWAPWNLVLEDDCSAGDDAELYSIEVITLRKRAIVSQGAFLCTGTHDFNDPNFQLLARPIEVGERAWIGARAFVNPGVTLGEGSVVGAMSMVTKSTDPWAIYGGNPARKIGNRTKS